MKIAPVGWIGKFRAGLICELISTVVNVILFWELGAVCACLGEGQRVWLGSAAPRVRFVSQQHSRCCFTVFKCLFKNKYIKLKILAVNFGAPARAEHKRRRCCCRSGSFTREREPCSSQRSDLAQGEAFSLKILLQTTSTDVLLSRLCCFCTCRAATPSRCFGVPAAAPRALLGQGGLLWTGSFSQPGIY